MVSPGLRHLVGAGETGLADCDPRPRDQVERRLRYNQVTWCEPLIHNRQILQHSADHNRLRFHGAVRFDKKDEQILPIALNGLGGNHERVGLPAECQDDADVLTWQEALVLIGKDCPQTHHPGRLVAAGVGQIEPPVLGLGTIGIGKRLDAKLERLCCGRDSLSGGLARSDKTR